MTGKTIDPKDLVPMNKFMLNEVFYLKNDDGSYSTCCISDADIVEERRANQLRYITQKYMADKKLFVNRNNPGKAITK